MICDLQGVCSSSKILLTDPAVHSRKEEFGPTDLGTYGMKLVLSGHKCNAICRRFGLSNPYKGIHIPNPGKKTSTYSFQVTEQLMMEQKNSHFIKPTAIAE